MELPRFPVITPSKTLAALRLAAPLNTYSGESEKGAKCATCCLQRECYIPCWLASPFTTTGTYPLVAEVEPKISKCSPPVTLLIMAVTPVTPVGSETRIKLTPAVISLSVLPVRAQAGPHMPTPFSILPP